MDKLARSVSVYLTAPDLDPDEISRLLATEPWNPFKKGDKHLIRGREHTRSYGAWSVESCMRIQSDEFDDHWRFVVHFVTLKADVLLALRDRGLPSRIRIFWPLQDDVLSAAMESEDLRVICNVVQAVDISVS